MTEGVKDLSNYLVCPRCKRRLQYQTETNAFNCNIHGSFPINDGIPSFANKNEFDEHWDSNLTKDIPNSKKIIAIEFLYPILKKYNYRNEITILDAGCGDGVHANVIHEFAKENNLQIKYTGLDVSQSALRAAKNRNVEYTFLNADISELPLKDDYFDIVFSFGVLAYMDVPTIGFEELVRVCKPSGSIGIWLYPKDNSFMGYLFLVVRKMCQKLGSKFTRVVADLIVPMLVFLPTKSGVNLKNSTWKQCREIVMVNIEPKQLSFFDEQDIKSWFKYNDVAIIFEDKINKITLWGEKHSHND